MFVDSHCHLTFAELSTRIDQVLAEMARAQVDRALCICTAMEEFEAVHTLARDHPNLWCTVGVHPDTEGGEEPSVEQLVRLAARPRVVGIGETGLDYYRLGSRTVADMEWQRDRFRTHVRAAAQSGLPLVVHTRSAGEDTLRILREELQPGVTGVFHCFTESPEVARAALDLGFMISFSGILTFRNADDLRAVAREVPLDRCLIETDSPYLAPVPHRGKPNSPAYVPWVARKLAELKSVDLDTIARHTTENFERLFARTALVRREIES